MATQAKQTCSMTRTWLWWPKPQEEQKLRLPVLERLIKTMQQMTNRIRRREKVIDLKTNHLSRRNRFGRKVYVNVIVDAEHGLILVENDGIVDGGHVCHAA